MSDIETTPVYEVGFVSPMNFGGFCAQVYAPTRIETGTKLYGQAAMDHLSEQLKHYRMAAEAEAALADRRQQEIDRLRAILAEKLDASTLLTGLRMTPGEVFMGFEGGAAGLLMMGLADQFEGAGGMNYVELRFTSKGEPFVVTIQRVRGLTPTQKLADATERMVVLERQRDDYLSREWQAERAKRQAETERDANQLDASRYRGMRDRLPWTITSSPVGLSLHFEIVSMTAAARVKDSEGNELDAAVDALLEAPQE